MAPGRLGLGECRNALRSRGEDGRGRSVGVPATVNILAGQLELQLPDKQRDKPREAVRLYAFTKQEL